MKKGSKEILCALAKRKMNFTELNKLVGSPTTVSKRLQELVSFGLVDREVQPNRFRKVRYSLTRRGAKTIELMKKLCDTIKGERLTRSSSPC